MSNLGERIKLMLYDSHLSVRLFCNAQQEEKRETQEESLQHADNNNNTRPKKQMIYVSWNIEIDHVFSR